MIYPTDAETWAREWHRRLRERFTARYGGHGGAEWDEMSPEWRADVTAVAASMLADLLLDDSPDLPLAVTSGPHTADEAQAGITGHADTSDGTSGAETP